MSYMVFDYFMDESITARMLLALCFVRLLSDVGQLLSEYVKSHVVKVE